MQKKVKILNVEFDGITLEEALSEALLTAEGKIQHYFATPNPEILLEAQKNPDFLSVLQNSKLNIADGIGILWASKFLKKVENKHSKFSKFILWLGTLAAIIFNPKYIRTELPERVTGIDLMNKISKKSGEKSLTIFLLGAAEGVAEKTKKILENKFSNIKITGTHSGSPHPNDEAEIITKINMHLPKILFVAYGAPKQEPWIARNLHKMPSVKLAIGVGGAFDFISGEKQRAKTWLQKIGLEWLHRLIQEPSRIGRIYNATIKFPITVLKSVLK